MLKKSIIEEIDPRRLLAQVARILDQSGIAYAVTGGVAVFVWGKPRFTADIDIVVQLKAESVDHLARVLRSLSEASYVSEEMMRHALAHKGEFNFIDGASGVKVDFWVLGDDPFEKSQLSRRIRRKVAGEKVFFVSPEDLILSKLRWYEESGSSRQLEDVESVLKIQKKLDVRYIRRWARVHGTSTLLEPLLKKKFLRGSTS